MLDLDGTLIKNDLFNLSLFSILRRNPLLVVSCAVWLTRDRQPRRNLNRLLTRSFDCNPLRDPSFKNCSIKVGINRGAGPQ
ncbi:hypothetical protein [Bradyrhizobium quebecense]|uniref:Uncharacterized protein n=2 Tax=Bradyrhizobium quebecense TaxID=2748629 RepID=A0ACD3VB60_9BRAD|nr:hypothetical protein [Bradyrhizobium quebecense]UGY03422.1 hypothetical protein J4P68_0001145 [Bradyrhizobium quebecense]